MAAVTLLGTLGNFSSASGTKSMAATPAVGDLIIIVTAHSDNSSATTPTDNNADGLGTYTKIISGTVRTSLDTVTAFVRNALVGSATSTTFTHAPGASSGGGIAVLKVTGMGRVGSSAIVQSAKEDNQTAGGTPTPTLGVAANTSNALISAVMNGTNPAGVNVRSSPAWTSRGSTGYTVPTTGYIGASINSGETGTALAWGSTSASDFASLAFELDTRGLSIQSRGFIF